MYRFESEALNKSPSAELCLAIEGGTCSCAIGSVGHMVAGKLHFVSNASQVCLGAPTCIATSRIVSKTVFLQTPCPSVSMCVCVRVSADAFLVSCVFVCCLAHFVPFFPFSLVRIALHGWTPQFNIATARCGPMDARGHVPDEGEGLPVTAQEEHGVSHAWRLCRPTVATGLDVDFLISGDALRGKHCCAV